MIKKLSLIMSILILAIFAGCSGNFNIEKNNFNDSIEVSGNITINDTEEIEEDIIDEPKEVIEDIVNDTNEVVEDIVNDTKEVVEDVEDKEEGNTDSDDDKEDEHDETLEELEFDSEITLEEMEKYYYDFNGANITFLPINIGSENIALNVQGIFQELETEESLLYDIFNISIIEILSSNTVKIGIIHSEDSLTCNDPDNGKDYFTKTEVEGLAYDWGILSTEDTCAYSGYNILIEYHCDENNQVKREFEHCLYGCDDGICLDETSLEYIDLNDYSKETGFIQKNMKGFSYGDEEYKIFIEFEERGIEDEVIVNFDGKEEVMSLFDDEYFGDDDELIFNIYKITNPDIEDYTQAIRVLIGKPIDNIGADYFKTGDSEYAFILEEGSGSTYNVEDNNMFIQNLGSNIGINISFTDLNSSYLIDYSDSLPKEVNGVIITNNLEEELENIEFEIEALEEAVILRLEVLN